MVDYKRPLDILEIAIRVDPTLTVNYIGAHSALNKKVLEVARRKGIRINFYDAITEEEKFKIIKQSKFMVFPSRFEGYGLPPAEALLIDYMHLPEVQLPQKGVVDGDGRCFSIACASIIAKVTRDRLMIELDRTHPGYGLANHKGYGTREHLACLYRLGPSPIHRRSFKTVRDML